MVVNIKFYMLFKKGFMMEKGFYDFSAKSLAGNEVQMSSYKGKVVLIVNTASKCGYTKQYSGLEKLYQKYKDTGVGLAILGFPCNQFGGQEPGDSSEIETFCRANYGVSFDMFEKVKVNGKEAHPLFVYLKKALPGIGETIKWNFTKFLIDSAGNPVERFSSATTAEEIEPHISQLLQ